MWNGARRRDAVSCAWAYYRIGVPSRVGINLSGNRTVETRKLFALPQLKLYLMTHAYALRTIVNPNLYFEVVQ